MDQLHEEATMGDFLVRAIHRGGDRTALISDGQPTSYRKLGDMLSQMLQLFDERGIRRGDGVISLSRNSLHAFVVSSTCYLAGVRLTNLHPLASADDHAFMLEDSGAHTLFFDPLTFADRAREIVDRVPGVQLMALGPCSWAPDAIAEAAAFLARQLVSRARSGDLSWLNYTGGTTGRPKGVIHTHRTHVAMTMAEMAEWDWPRTPVFLAITPISHGAGACLMPVLLLGGTIVMENGFTPAKFFEIVKQHDVSATFLVPTMIYKLLDYVASHEIGETTLQLAIYGAAPMVPARLREAIDRFGPIFMQLYGQTEAPNCVTVLRQNEHVTTDDKRLTSCGSPMYNSQVALLDEQDQEVKVGELGEICVRGPLVMEGYWNRPEETSQALRGGWLHTGDLARSDEEGYLYIAGRSKDMIITGGFNVYPAEVEDALTAHEAVSTAAIIGVPDATWGEAVTAVVVLRGTKTATENELISWVRDAKGVVCAPKKVHFVDDIPVTSLGKPDKKALRARYASSV